MTSPWDIQSVSWRLSICEWNINSKKIIVKRYILNFEKHWVVVGVFEKWHKNIERRYQNENFFIRPLVKLKFLLWVLLFYKHLIAALIYTFLCFWCLTIWLLAFEARFSTKKLAVSEDSEQRPCCCYCVHPVLSLCCQTPSVQVLYGKSNPELLQYIYLLAPIQLLILNPIGFMFMEIHKQNKSELLWGTFEWGHYEAKLNFFHF